MPQQEGLDRYLAAIGETGLLGKQEECRLCEDGYAGRMVLVERKLRLGVAVATRLDVSLEQLQISEGVHRLAASLEALVFERDGGGDGPRWKDVVADQFPSVDAAVIGSVFGEEVWSVVERMLPAKELRVLELRFGRGGGEIRTLKQVGEVIGASYEWVRKLEQRALQRLRDSPKFAHFD